MNPLPMMMSWWSWSMRSYEPDTLLLSCSSMPLTVFHSDRLFGSLQTYSDTSML